MVKFFLFFLFSLNLFGQEVSLPTQFSADGNLYKKLNENLNELSQPIAEFFESDKCIVIDYLGRDNYKVKFKEWVGIVPVDDLEVTEEIMDLYYAYQEKQRAKAIEVKEEREEKILKIRGEDEETLKAIREQFVRDSISKRVAEQKVIREQFVRDSISKRLARQKAIREQFVRDSISKRVAEQKVIREQFVRDSISKRIAHQKVIRAEFVEDSIARVVSQQKLMRAGFIKDSLDQAVLEQKIIRDFFVKDSIAKVFASQKATRAQFVRDSISKRVAVQKVIRAQFVRDSITENVATQNVLKEQFAKDSIAKSAEELMAVREQFIKDSITASFKVRQLKREQFIRDSIVKSLNKNRVINDSIGKEVETISLEFRNTCHYSINEFDPFYNVKTIRTEAYTVAENVTMELYKQGRKTNIFLNSKDNLGCVSYFSHNRSSIRVALENNQVISFYHSWDMECGEFLFKGNLSKSQISILKNSPIKSIRLRGTKGSAEISNIIYKEFFMDKLKCIED